MSAELTEKTRGCPYCAERIALLIDPSVDEQRYIEDCSICCRPIEIIATALDGKLLSIELSRSD